jgi:integrase
VPLIPTAARLLDAHLASVNPKEFIFETLRGGPADLEGMVRKIIRPKLVEAGLPWYGLHAFRRGLATNLHELGIADIVIQAIPRHSDVSVTRQAYIKRDAVDPRSLAAMATLEAAVSSVQVSKSSPLEQKRAAN